MNNQLIFLLCTIGYIASAYFAWKWIHIAFSRGGRFYTQELGGIEIFFIIVPFANTICALVLWGIASPVRDKERDFSAIRNLAKRFFKIKQ